MSAIFERCDISTARKITPIFNEMTGQFAFTRVCGQNLAVALVTRALTHVKFTSFKVVLGVDFSGTFFKKRGFQRVAKSVAFNSLRPSLFTLRFVRMVHVLG